MNDYADQIAARMEFEPALVYRLAKGEPSALVAALAIAIRTGYNLRDGVGK